METNKITEDYVSFETAKLLKEKGFNETCRAFWKDWNGQTMLCHCSRNHVFDWCNNSMLEKHYNDNEETNIAAPTLQMACKWLREIHNYFIEIDYDSYKTEDGDSVTTQIGYSFSLQKKEKPDEYEYIHDWVYDTYEETVESAIKYCLTNLIK